MLERENDGCKRAVEEVKSTLKSLDDENVLTNIDQLIEPLFLRPADKLLALKAGDAECVLKTRENGLNQDFERRTDPQD